MTIQIFQSRIIRQVRMNGVYSRTRHVIDRIEQAVSLVIGDRRGRVLMSHAGKSKPCPTGGNVDRTTMFRNQIKTTRVR